MPKKNGDTLPVDLPAEGVCSALGVDAEGGLSDRDAARRHRREGENNIYTETRTSVWRYIAYCSFDLLIIILLLTALTAAIFKEDLAYSVIIPTLAVSIVLRTAAYIAARRRLEACSSAEEVMPRVTVLRSGEKKRIDARLVVRGDIIYFSEGDIVPADCRLISSEKLSVYEEQATGVLGAVSKDADSDGGASLVSRANTVYAGSSVLGGSCKAVVVYIGADTLVVRTRGYFRTTRRGTMRLSRLLDSYSRKWGAVMALVAFAVTVVDLIFGGRSLFEVFFLGLTLAAATMCEYYSAIGDIAASFGISSLEKKLGVSVRGVRAIETLAELDAVIVPAEGVVVRDGIECEAFFCDGEITDRTKETPDGSADAAAGVEVPEALLRYASMTTRSGGDGSFSEISDVIDSYLVTLGLPEDKIYGDGETPVHFAGLSDGLTFDTRLLSSCDAFMSVSCGAADKIVGACAFIETNGQRSEISNDVRTGLLNFISHHERRGATAVAVAKKNTPFKSPERLAFTQFDMTLVGVMILYRPLAEGAVEAVEACRRAGIRVIMTGEGVEAARLAERAGIISGKDDIITGWEFSKAEGEERKRAAARARLLIGFDARRIKEFIAETGDPGRIAYVASDARDMRGELSALSSVGAGFAISDGAREGSQTLKMRADTIVPRADGDGGGLYPIVSSVAYAKRIYKNVSNIVNYLLTSQSARIFAVLLTVISDKTSISPQEILLWGLIFDFFAVLVIASEGPDITSLSLKTDVYERLSHPIAKLWPSVVTGLVWALPTVLTPLLYMNGTDMRATLLFVSVLVSLVAVCGEYRSERPVFSPRRSYNIAAFLVAGAVSLTVIALTVIPGVSSALALARPDALCLALSLIPAAIELAFYEIVRLFTHKEIDRSAQVEPGKE